MPARSKERVIESASSSTRARPTKEGAPRLPEMRILAARRPKGQELELAGEIVQPRDRQREAGTDPPPQAGLVQCQQIGAEIWVAEPPPEAVVAILGDRVGHVLSFYEGVSDGQLRLDFDRGAQPQTEPEVRPGDGFFLPCRETQLGPGSPVAH
jgi:hypothetical protein